jgi:hypothetical protein
MVFVKKRKEKNMKNSKKLLITTAAALFGFNLFIFLYFYSFYLLSGYAPEFYSAVSFAYELFMPTLFDLGLLLTPIVIGAVMLLSGIGVGKGLLFAAVASFSRVIYFIPAYYLQYVLVELYDSVDALLVGFLRSLIWVGASFALSVASYLILRFTLGTGAKGDRSSHLEYKGLFAFDNRLSLGFGIIAAAGFLYELIMQIIATAEYFAESAGDYLPIDIVYMAVFYLLTLASLFVFYITPELIRKRALGQGENLK